MTSNTFAKKKRSKLKKSRLTNSKDIYDQSDPVMMSLHVPGMIARKKKPHTIGELFIKPAALKMAEIMLGKDAAKRL